MPALLSGANFGLFGAQFAPVQEVSVSAGRRLTRLNPGEMPPYSVG